MKNATPIGNFFDTFAREFFIDPNRSFKDFMEILKEHPDYAQMKSLKIDENMYNSLRTISYNKIVSTIATQLNPALSNLYFMPTETFLHAKFENGIWNGVGGTTDLIVIDGEGDVHIVDFKTLRVDAGLDISQQFNTKVEGTGTYKSKRSAWTEQLTAYAAILGKELGVIPTIRVAVLPVSYTRDGLAFKGDPNSSAAVDKFHPKPKDLSVTPNKKEDSDGNMTNEDFAQVLELKFDDNNEIAKELAVKPTKEQKEVRVKKTKKKKDTQEAKNTIQKEEEEKKKKKNKNSSPQGGPTTATLRVNNNSTINIGENIDLMNLFENYAESSGQIDDGIKNGIIYIEYIDKDNQPDNSSKVSISGYHAIAYYKPGKDGVHRFTEKSENATRVVLGRINKTTFETRTNETLKPGKTYGPFQITDFGSSKTTVDPEDKKNVSVDDLLKMGPHMYIISKEYDSDRNFIHTSKEGSSFGKISIFDFITETLKVKNPSKIKNLQALLEDSNNSGKVIFAKGDQVLLFDTIPNSEYPINVDHINSLIDAASKEKGGYPIWKAEMEELGKTITMEGLSSKREGNPDFHVAISEAKKTYKTNTPDSDEDIAHNAEKIAPFKNIRGPLITFYSLGGRVTSQSDEKGKVFYKLEVQHEDGKPTLKSIPMSKQQVIDTFNSIRVQIKPTEIDSLSGNPSSETLKKLTTVLKLPYSYTTHNGREGIEHAPYHVYATLILNVKQGKPTDSGKGTSNSTVDAEDLEEVVKNSKTSSDQIGRASCRERV